MFSAVVMTDKHFGRDVAAYRGGLRHSVSADKVNIVRHIQRSFQHIEGSTGITCCRFTFHVFLGVSLHLFKLHSVRDTAIVR